MKLYYSAPSPFARKVRVALYELDLNIEMEAVLGTPTDPGNLPLDLNPLGKIPCLTTDHGTLFDSRVITRFLNDHSNGSLYPTGDALWPALARETIADGILEAAVLMVYEKRCRPEEIVFETWRDAQWAKIDRALAVLNDTDLGSDSLPDLAVAVALEYVDFRITDKEWRKSYPKLSDWGDSVGEKPSMLATRPE
ncbi:MAG: glutathione S-transferase family protein [Pseudomonadota bacterium]